MNLCLKLLVVGFLLWDKNNFTSGNSTTVTGHSTTDSHQSTTPSPATTTAVFSTSTQGGDSGRCDGIEVDNPTYKTYNETLTLKDKVQDLSTLNCSIAEPETIPSSAAYSFTLGKYKHSIPVCAQRTYECTLQNCTFDFSLDAPPESKYYTFYKPTVYNTVIVFTWKPNVELNCTMSVSTTCSIREPVWESVMESGNEQMAVTQEQPGPSQSLVLSAPQDVVGKYRRVTEKVENLKPYTNYSCTSYLKYQDYNITNTSVLLRTKIGKPGNVTNLTCRTAKTNITCNWKAPEISNGPLSGYKICLEESGKCIYETKIKNDKLTFEYTELRLYTIYRFKIKAYNFEEEYYVNGDDVINITQTEEGIPEKVKDASASIGSQNNIVIIRCDKPVHINGRNGKYVVQYNGKKEIQNHCKFEIKQLSYLTNYNFEVFYNSTYEGEKIKLKIKTKYNDKALIGFLAFLIVITSLALLLVLFKIYKLKKKSSSHDEYSIPLNYQEEELLNIEPIPVEKLLDTYKRKNADEGRLFLDEFQSIPRVFSKFPIKEARIQCNQPKNRYIDILPYDENRVVLSEIHGQPGSDYINASYINGFKEPRKYIAAQGPKEETMNDFWRMIWEQKSTIIVMVTRCEEGNRNKCAQYWPSTEAETEEYGDIVVKITEEKFFPDYITRKLHIITKREKSERDITHIQFTVWPDHGVPDDPNLLLKLRRRVNALSNFFSGPIIVHCSAGVGRTGTYISIDAMLEGLEAEGRVDVYGYVVQLRRQRCLMVQVESQYIFIHKSLVEYNQFGETEVSMAELPLVLNNLNKSDAPSEPSQLKCEFQRLPSYLNWRPQNKGNHQENKEKNRNSSVIPYEYNRVHIKGDNEPEHEHNEDSELSSDEDSDSEDSIYINASYIIGYWGKHEIIATQSPLENTLAEFWKMIYQKKIKAVVMLSSSNQENNEEACAPYWKEKSRTFDDLEVELTSEKSGGSYTERCFELRGCKRKDVRKVCQFHYDQWEDKHPKDTQDLLEMIEKLRNDIPPIRMEEQHRHDKSVPLLVHCSDGSQRTGTFCALWNLLESANVEGVIDVFQAVKNLRRQRSGIVSSFEQYQFLYDTLASTAHIQNGQVKSSIHHEDKVEIQNELESNIPDVKETAASLPSSEVDATSKPSADEQISDGPSDEVTLRIDE